MNPYCANRGDVLKHLVFCELLAEHVGGPLTYIDACAGRPFNRLDETGYLFADPERAKSDWADGFLTEALRRVGPLADSQYASLLCQAHQRGSFFADGVLAERPVYPGSVGFAWLSRQQIPTTWICAETDDSDREALCGLLGPGATVMADLLGRTDMWPELLSGSTEPVFAFVDPFNLTADDKDGAQARRFFTTAAEQGAEAVAWYPIGSRFDSRAIDHLADAPSPSAVRLEARWKLARASSLNGAGLLCSGIRRDLTDKVVELLSALGELPGWTTSPR